VNSAVAPGQTYKLRVDRVGDRIDVYRDGAKLATATDSAFVTGKVGLGAKGNAASFDNLVLIGTAAPAPTTAPIAPASLTATTHSSSRIVLAWADQSSDEDGFKVERSDDGGNVWKEIAIRAANVKTFVVDGLTAATSYLFRVRAFNAAGDSAYSNVASATTQAAPQLGDKPGAGNTGPTNASALKASGSITSSHDGQIIENVHVTGTIEVRHKNVVIRNFKVTGTSSYGIRVYEGGPSAIIEDGEITGAGVGAGVYGVNYTARRLNIHHLGGDGLKAEANVVIENCWVHHLGLSPGSHADGIQVQKGANFIFRNNNFEVQIGVNNGGEDPNAAIFLGPAFGPIDNVLIEGNWMNGGNYTIYSNGCSNVRIQNNFFGRNYRYGTLSSSPHPSSPIVWLNNRWLDTLVNISF
jgi:hypothetical protein